MDATQGEHRWPKARIRDFRIVDTTLREGEQFPGAFFSAADRLELARRLDEFGVDEIEVPSPVVSPSAADGLSAILALGLRAQVRVHLRCDQADIERALDCGAQGLHLFVGASPELTQHSLRDTSSGVARRVRDAVRLGVAGGAFTRFSTEDAFRTPPDQLFLLLDAAVEAGAHRLGLPDTVGVATPSGVQWLFHEIHRRYPGIPLEFHGHNDSGSAVANAFAALEAGADAVDVTILGIGERTGITSLGGLIARLYTIDPALVRRYRLQLLPELDAMVARLAGVEVPFSQPITSRTAFTHVAGVHSNAALSSPSAYEAIDPADFGLDRDLPVGSRLTGRRAVARFARDRLGVEMSDDLARRATWAIKWAAEREPLSPAAVETILRQVLGQESDPEMMEVTT
ncbi:MAG: LeuA family protein [Candidatus Dormibacteria bacterium]